MESLNLDEIDKLEAAVQQRRGTRAPREGGKTRAGKIIDTNERTYQVWFKLAHHIMESDEASPSFGDPMKCENPNCEDVRVVALVAEVSGKMMCRHCFLGGWLLTPDTGTQEPQTALPV